MSSPQEQELLNLKQKIAEFVQGVGFNVGTGEVRPDLTSGKVEKDAHEARRGLYVGCILVAGVIISVIVFGYVLYPFFGALLSARKEDDIKNLIWQYYGYAFGGEAKRNNTSKIDSLGDLCVPFKTHSPTIGERIIVTLMLLSMLGYAGAFLAQSVELLIQEFNYFGEIDKIEIGDSFKRDDCIELAENKLIVYLITGLLFSGVIFAILWIPFRDQMADDLSYFMLWALLMGFMFLSFGFLIASYIKIFIINGITNSYDCDKFFPAFSFN
jgi:hypothetical protein